MENDENMDLDEENQDVEVQADTSSRARNRTVMLTPEITGEVRARLAQDVSPQAPAFGAGRGGSGFESAIGMTLGSSYSPAVESKGGKVNNNVGAAQTTKTAVVEREGVVWSKETPIIGFLVSYDLNPNGTVFELRSGRLIVTSESAGSGNYMVIKDDSVSPMHAILRITAGGEVQVLDQLSEFGTRLQRFGSEDETELSGDKASLEHGDIVKFGSRRFHVCIVARGDGA